MYNYFFKRILDIVISVLVLIVLFPVFIGVIIALLIVNDGKVFFTQTRAGKNGVLFNLIKFKSMNDKKDKEGFLLKDTDRLTKTGQFIRKTSIDELPQVFNILKGDMSVVGPRPLLPEYLPYYTDYHKMRHNVKPGITGLAQVSGRNTLKFSQRFNLDVEYVKTRSFF
ncbi:sugar transferase [Tenacibaculum aquimarinum]|uniref:sugar transferase n=1 Tax=Tenacibaculum aquimarinum TaxID=2910675 RepID=UPI001F0AF668|nr:sugar transferase [Tenacibaculum aquimarinum]MCH3884620.1 sugar transferase [Tenacibaculum aquimarinum]